MIIEKIKTPGLSHLSYIGISEGNAFVVDPRRDFNCYLDISKAHQARIRLILETHRNEDLISGSAALANATDADVWHGPNADGTVRYASVVGNEDECKIGNMLIRVLETPGHTKDSISFLVTDTDFDAGPVAIFTGDALFVGDVGRTDFYPDETREMAGRLYDSLQAMKREAPDAIIYPAHGAGSVCGDGMADREFSTISHEFANNPALRQPSREAFIDMKEKEHHYMPPYFKEMERANLEGAAPYERKSLALSWEELRGVAEDPAVQVVDVRSGSQYISGHLPGVYSLPQSMLAAYAGWLFDWQRDLVLIAESVGEFEDAVDDLSRIGFNQIKGWYAFDAPSHAAKGRPIETIPQISAKTVARRVTEASNWTLLDVRKLTEFNEAHIESARHVYLGHLPGDVKQADLNQQVTVMCQSGKRATVGAAFLKARGHTDVEVFMGSMGAWQAAGGPVTSAE